MDARPPRDFNRENADVSHDIGDVDSKVLDNGIWDAANVAPIANPSVKLCNASPNRFSSTADENITLHCDLGVLFLGALLSFPFVLVCV